MKIITVLELKNGMELGEDVEALGSVLYKAGTKVDEKVIDRIKRHGIMCVSIMEDVDYATTHYEKIHFDEDYQKFCSVYSTQLSNYKGVMISYLQTKQSISPDTLLDIYESCSSMIKSDGMVLDYIYNMVPNEDELTYTSSFNSALLCGAFANMLNLPEDEKKTLILCGFYYDIGKWKIPNEILWKPGKLTEEEFALVKKHPVMGYAEIRNDINLDEHIKNAVIMHHERYDGSGYPYHMTGKKIDKYARYMAIIDTYIAMASPRSFRPAFPPLAILGNFETSMDKYDASILMPLLAKIADTQIGSQVQLSDDSIWEVIMIQKHSFSKPMLKNKNNDIFDLSSNPGLKIVKMV